MERYKNLSRQSGVTHYELGDDYIRLRFINGSEYIYNDSLPGGDVVDVMKELAVRGRGLSTFVAQEVRERYYRKVR